MHSGKDCPYYGHCSSLYGLGCAMKEARPRGGSRGGGGRKRKEERSTGSRETGRGTGDVEVDEGGARDEAKVKSCPSLGVRAKNRVCKEELNRSRENKSSLAIWR
jgi:hypothetical protein